MSPCSPLMFAAITCFALVKSPVHLQTAVSFGLTAVCEANGGFISVLFAVHAVRPICRGSITGSFSPLTEKNKSAYMDDDDAGLEKKTAQKNFITSQWRSKHSFHHGQELCAQYGMGPELHDLAPTSFIWGRRHCCLEFGISPEQHHPSYLRRSRHHGGLHTPPCGKVNSSRWVVRWKD